MEHLQPSLEHPELQRAHNDILDNYSVAGNHPIYVLREPNPLGAEAEPKAAMLWHEYMDGQTGPNLLNRALELYRADVQNPYLRQLAIARLTLPGSKFVLPHAQERLPSIEWLRRQFTTHEYRGVAPSKTITFKNALEDNPQLADDVAQSVLFWLNKDGGDVLEQYGNKNISDEFRYTVRDLLGVVDDDTSLELLEYYENLFDEDKPNEWLESLLRDKEVPEDYKQYAMHELFNNAQNDIRLGQHRHENSAFNALSSYAGELVLSNATRIDSDHPAAETLSRIIGWFEDNVPEGEPYFRAKNAISDAKYVKDEELRFKLLSRHLPYAFDTFHEHHMRDDDIPTLEWAVGEAERHEVPWLKELKKWAQPYIDEYWERRQDIEQFINHKDELSTKTIQLGERETSTQEGATPGEKAIDPESLQLWNEILATKDSWFIYNLFENPEVEDPDLKWLIERYLTAPTEILESDAFRYFRHHASSTLPERPDLASRLAELIQHWVGENGAVFDMTRPDGSPVSTHPYGRVLQDLMEHVNEETADKLFECLERVEDPEGLRMLVKEKRHPHLDKYKDEILERMFKDAKTQLQAGIDGSVLDERESPVGDLTTLLIFAKPEPGSFDEKAVKKTIKFFEDNLSSDMAYIPGQRELKSYIKLLEDTERFPIVWRHIWTAKDRPEFSLETDEDLQLVAETIQEAMERSIPGAQEAQADLERVVPKYNKYREALKQEEEEKAKLWAELLSA